MKKYDVFISYSRKDYFDGKGIVIPGNVVSKIKEALSSAEITYWFDEDGIDHGDDFAEKIVANIEVSEIFVFLSTVNSNSSKWTRKEIACAHEMDKKIIPVRIDASKYDRSVMLRIADLDYLDYAKNPDKGIKDLVETVKRYLLEKQEQKQEEIKQSEEIREIELLIKKLKAEEFTLDVSRDDLIVRIQRLDDEMEKNRLLGLIDDNSQTSAKIKEKDIRISELKKENQKLKNEIRGFNTNHLKKKYIVTIVVLSLIISVLGFNIMNRSSKFMTLITNNNVILDTINNTINGHAYVDLGLPSGLKWATCNFGANSPEEYGSYFSYRDGCDATWGGGWRTPKIGEFKELRSNCSWQWTAQNGVNGYKVTGVNGNSIFLPAAGYRYGTSLNYAGSYGYYCCSAPLGNNYAYYLNFNSSSHFVSIGNRNDGYTVRPVRE